MASFSDTNINELEALRGQLQQLQELFSTMIEETRPGADNPTVIGWEDLVSKFNIVAARYATLSQAISKTHAQKLQQLSVAPSKQLQNDHEQQILSVLLRTKLAPEIERAEERIRTAVDEDAARDTQNRTSFGGGGNRDVQSLKYWNSKVELHDSLALTAEMSFREMRKGHAKRVKELLEAKTKTRTKTKEADSSEMDVDGEKGDAAEPQVALEDILAFMTSGDSSVIAKT